MGANEPMAESLLRFCKIDSFEVSSGGEVFNEAVSMQTAVVCLSGAGMMVSAEDVSQLNEGMVYLLTPELSFRLLADSEPLKGFILHFEAYTVTKEQAVVRAKAFMKGQFRAGDLQLLAPTCNRLLQWQASGKQEAFAGQEGLYRLMSLLIEVNLQEESKETTASAIARVSAFMQLHLDRELTRNELAGLAGLSPGYFSWAFQQYIGKTPTVYLMEARVARAKELLLSGGGVKETAARVGFDDEFYFSRRFKQKTGFSPLAYVKSRRRSIASVSDPLSGSLLALQLLPKAAALYPNHGSHSRMIRLHSFEPGEGEGWEENVKLLHAAEPELIFCTDLLNERARTELEQIAPTVAIPWLSTDWREQLGTIADAVDQREEAKRWLAEYDRKAEAAYRKVRSKIGGATINIWRITGPEYRIYGTRNAGTVLYRDFGLAATHKLDAINVFITVDKEALIHYDADILIIMVDSTEQAAREWQALQASELWEQLMAVRNGRVVETGTEKLFEYSAWSHERALSYFMQLFG